MTDPFHFPETPEFPSLFQTKDPDYVDGFINYVHLFETLANTSNDIRYDPQEFISGSKWSNFSQVIIHYKNIYPVVDFGLYKEELKVEAKLCATKGYIDPNASFTVDIDFKSYENAIKYFIKVPYLAKDDPDIKEEFAIVLSFNSYYHWVKAIRMLRKYVNTDIEQFIFKTFKDELDNVAIDNRDLLDSVYEKAPLWVIAKFGYDKVFKDLKNILESDTIDEIGTNEESAILKMIRSFVTAPFFYDLEHFYEDVKKSKRSEMAEYEANVLTGNINKFLADCLEQKMKNKQSVFQRMYYKLNDYGGTDNFSKYIKLMYAIWLNSEYPHNHQFDNVSDESEYVVIDYHAKKILGFYGTNFDFEFAGKKINVFPKVPYALTTLEKVGSIYTYQPIRIPKKVKDGTLQTPENIIPGFFIKAIDDKNFWSDVESASWLALDVITTASGIGNLIKLRHLASVSRVVISGIEVASGTLSIMLRLLEDYIDPEFRDNLQTFLIYLDLFSLGGGSLNKRLLRDSAKNAYDSMPRSLRKKYPEVKDKLHDFSSRKLDSASYIERGRSNGQLLSSRDLEFIFDHLKKQNVDFQMVPADGDHVVTGYFLKSGKPVILTSDNAAMFITSGRRNSKIVLREQATVMEFFHEYMHLQDFKNRGYNKYVERKRWQREEYVFDKIVQHHKLFTKKELIGAEKYIRRVFNRAGVTNQIGDPIIKTLPDEIGKIPLTRKPKPVSIRKIIKLK